MLTKDYLVEQATTYEANQEWQNAIQAYLQAIALDPKDAYIRNSLGIVYENVADLDQAEACYRQAMKLAPSFYAAHYNLIQLYRGQERVADRQQLIIDLYVTTPDYEQRKELRELLVELNGEEIAVCHQCRCISPHIKAFKQRGPKALCPHCIKPYQEQKRRSIVALQVGIPITLLIISLVATFFMATPVGLALHYLATNLLLVIVAFSGFHLLHEAVRALAIVLAGGMIFEVILGYGDLRWKQSVGQVTIVVNQVLGLATTVFGFPTNLHLLRLRTIVALLVPNCLHLTIAIALWQGLPIAQFTSTYALRDVVILANLILLLNLLPFYFLPQIISDGTFILGTLLDKKNTDRLIEMYYVKQAASAYRQHKFEIALEWVEKGLEKVPHHTGEILRSANSCAMGNGDFHKACIYSEQFIQVAPHNLEVQAIGFNNLAYAKVFTGDLDAAYHYAQKALRIRPWSHFEMSTLGMILVEMGDVEHGMPYLEESLRRSTDRAEAILAVLAYGHWRKGDLKQAETLLQQATQLDPSAFILRYVQNKMQMQPQ